MGSCNKKINQCPERRIKEYILLMTIRDASSLYDSSSCTRFLAIVLSEYLRKTLGCTSGNDFSTGGNAYTFSRAST